jgi:hypothetical protein
MPKRTVSAQSTLFTLDFRSHANLGLRGLFLFSPLDESVFDARLPNRQPHINHQFGLNDGSVSVTVFTVLTLRLLLILFFAITGSRGGTDGQPNGGCIRSRYDIDVSVFTSRHAKTPTLSTSGGWVDARNRIGLASLALVGALGVAVWHFGPARRHPPVRRPPSVLRRSPAAISCWTCTASPTGARSRAGCSLCPGFGHPIGEVLR